MMRRSLPRWLVALWLAAGLLRATPAGAVDEDVESFARVVVAESELRAGPGVSHRVIYRAKRGESFAIEGRESSGFWLRVYLPDGRTAFVLGDTIEPVALDPDSDEAPDSWAVFSPPALQYARGGFSMLGGVFDGSGYAEIKPALVLAPSVALEPYAGLGLTSEGRRLLYGAAATVNFAPDWVIAPFVLLGGGGLTTFPNNDSFLLEKGTSFHARAGGGLLLSLRWRVLVRLEATHMVLFEPDFYRNTQSYLGGLGTYF